MEFEPKVVTQLERLVLRAHCRSGNAGVESMAVEAQKQVGCSSPILGYQLCLLVGFGQSQALVMATVMSTVRIR